MVEINRVLDILGPLSEKSLFLFGPRQTGKSFLIRQKLADCPVFNLLDQATFLRLARDHTRLRQEIPMAAKIVVIDEVQMLPSLLNEVHLLIEERGIHFLLTGSSARKLKRSNVNLLGGRARRRDLSGFVYPEMKEVGFDLLQVLSYGTLPSIFLSKSPREDLLAYVRDYLQLEITQEGLTRDLPGFNRFLQVAASYNAQQINFTALSNDAQVKLSTVRNYFTILQDTLIASELPVWQKSKLRKAAATPKLYFFDVGVVRTLQERGSLRDKSPDFGESFEAWIYHEIKSYVDYFPVKTLHYWRTLSQFEVDFVLDGRVAIEVKAKRNVGIRDLAGLRALREEQLLDRYFVVSLDEVERTTEDGIQIVHWRSFLDRLWSHQL